MVVRPSDRTGCRWITPRSDMEAIPPNEPSRARCLGRRRAPVGPCCRASRCDREPRGRRDPSSLAGVGHRSRPLQQADGELGEGGDLRSCKKLVTPLGGQRFDYSIVPNAQNLQRTRRLGVVVALGGRTSGVPSARRQRHKFCDAPGIVGCAARSIIASGSDARTDRRNWSTAGRTEFSISETQWIATL